MLVETFQNSVGAKQNKSVFQMWSLGLQLLLKYCFWGNSVYMAWFY